LFFNTFIRKTIIIAGMEKKDRHAMYFEGILQLRNRQNPMFDKALSYIDKRLDEVKATIAKVVKSPDGIDLYISSNKAIRKLERELKTAFGCDTLISPSLYSQDRQSSKNLYRLTCCARLPAHSPGDIVRERGRFVELSKTGDGKGVGIELMTGKKVTLKDYEFIAPAKDSSEAVVIQKKPNLMVLHPSTFQGTTVANPRQVNSAKVKVIDIDGILYLLPAKKQL
jgi:NMD protein affecting ribosome stability and mRNA decay